MSNTQGSHPAAPGGAERAGADQHPQPTPAGEWTDFAAENSLNPEVTDSSLVHESVEGNVDNSHSADRGAGTSDADRDADAAALEPAVVAKGIAVYGDEGVVFGPLDFHVPGSGLTMLTGRGGSGRTALALALSGRMKIQEGSLKVLGYEKAKDIRTHVAIAGVDEIDAIDRDVTVRTIITEHRAWSSRFFRWVKKADDDYYRRLLEPVYGERDLPPLDAYVSQISGLDRYLIRIALALNPADGGTIGMLVMDDLEQVHEFTDRLILVNILSRLAHKIPVIVNAVNPPPTTLVEDYTLIELFTDASHLQPVHEGFPQHLVHIDPHSHYEAQAEQALHPNEVVAQREAESQNHSSRRHHGHGS